MGELGTLSLTLESGNGKIGNILCGVYIDLVTNTFNKISEVRLSAVNEGLD